MKAHKHTLKPLAVAVVAALILPSFTYAQDTQTTKPAAEDSEFELITVTSRKRKETLIEVPMSVSSVSALEISNRNLLNKDD